MKKISDQYLSNIAKNITPYQWEEDLPTKCLRFDTNTLPYPPKSLIAFLESLKKNCPINEYADPTYIKLKKLIARYESVSIDNICVTNSGDEGIDILNKVFINKDDFVIVTPPTYDMFYLQTFINGGQVLEIPLSQNNFNINEKKIITRSKNARVKIIFLCVPNNPTGSIISQETIKKILKYSRAIVIVDEVYREFYGKSVVPLLTRYPNLVILRSFSKFAGIAGARIGYLIASKNLREKFDAVRFPMGVSYFSYKLAEFVLEKDQQWITKQVNIIKKERKRVSNNLTSLGFHVFPSKANFILVKIGPQATNLSEKLKNKKIIIRDRSKKKYLTGCIRITIRSPWENDQLIKEMTLESDLL